MEQVLSDVKILDLSWYIAGPYCAKILADYGADIIKVEKPGEGDPARTMGPFHNDEPHPEKSGLFLHLNTNKKGITLNLKSNTGRKILKELVSDVDILINSFSPGVMEKLGLSFDELIKINPKLVMTSISNFGQTGPYRDYKSNDLISYAMGGSMLSTGIPSREPVNLARNIKMYECGWLAATATLGVWMGTYRDGIGDHIDFSIMEALSGSTDRRSAQLLGYNYCGNSSPRLDPKKLRRFFIPTNVFPVKDDWVLPSIVPARWPAFAKALGRPELVKDPRFENISDTSKAQDLDDIFREWIGDKDKEEVCAEMQSLGSAVTPINTPADIMNSEHFKERGFWVEIDHPATGKLTYPGAPIDMSDGGFAIRRPAPLLGQYNQEVYENLGYTKEDLITLRGQKVI
jgi:crotonobetainyl-CoA:carnitine CoA-transferase CaiB-like acyl-CoA transferase